MAPDAQLYLVCVAPRSISSRRWRMRRARASTSSTSRPAGRARSATTAPIHSARSSPTPGPAASSGSTRQATRRDSLGRLLHPGRRLGARCGARTATRATRSSGRTDGRSADSSGGTSGRTASPTSTSRSVPVGVEQRCSRSPRATDRVAATVRGALRRAVTGRDLVVYWAIVGYRVTTSPQLDLVGWSQPLEYSVAAGSIAAPATSPAAFAVGALCWQSRAARAVQLAGADDRRTREARHRRSRQRLQRDVRGVRSEAARRDSPARRPRRPRLQVRLRS